MTAPTTTADNATTDQAPKHTGGMVALVPTEEDAAKLAVDGGDPPDELHLTLAYLGDVTDWDPELIDAVHQVATQLTDASADPSADTAGVPEDGQDTRSPAQRGPLTLNVFAHSHFYPNGGPDDQEPCMVYQFSGDGDLPAVESLASDAGHRIKDAVGDVNYPEQYSPFKPHVTAGYNLPPDSLSYTGPVSFDRLRVVLGDDTTDYSLGGNEADGITAAVARTKGGSVKAESRAKAQALGFAMDDGGFPIYDGKDLDNAIQSVGRAKDPEAARRHIIKQAKRLRLESRIPDSWNTDGTVTASAELDVSQRDAITAAVGALVEKLGPVQAYGLTPSLMTSPAALEFADTLIELPCDDALTASGEQLPSVDLFTPPANMPPGTGLYVDGNRVYGRLAEWNIPHIGASGQTIYPPRSPSGYRWFHTKTARVQGPDGPDRIKIGHITFGTGHASTDGTMTHLAAAAHYDNSGFRGAKVRMSEDEHGPVFAGVLCSGIEGAKLEEFEESDVSGDWRRIMGNLELVAALCVNVGGFPKVGLSLAASGEPLALVASAKAWGNPASLVDVDAIAAAVVSRMEKRERLNGQRTALLAALDDSGERMRELLDDLDDDFGSDEIQFIDANSSIEDGLTAAGKSGKNWVQQTGTGHLPRYIKRIEKHLRRKGMTESRAIAVAVNVVKRMCATGDLNFKGAQQVNAKSRAEACAAVAEWEAKKAQARAT